MLIHDQLLAPSTPAAGIRMSLISSNNVWCIHLRYYCNSTTHTSVGHNYWWLCEAHDGLGEVVGFDSVHLILKKICCWIRLYYSIILSNCWMLCTIHWWHKTKWWKCTWQKWWSTLKGLILFEMSHYNYKVVYSMIGYKPVQTAMYCGDISQRRRSRLRVPHMGLCR